MSVNTFNYQTQNFLASASYQNFTQQATTTMKSGDIFKDASGNALGIVFDDVTATTDEPAPVAVMVNGWVYGSLLNGLTDDLKAQLVTVGIKFYDDPLATGVVPNANTTTNK